MQLLITTNRGLEKMLAAELREPGAGIDPPAITLRPWDLHGHVLAGYERAELGEVWPAVRRLRCAHHVMRPVISFTLPDSGDALPGIRRRLAECEIPGMSEAGSFRVTTKRHGDHEFTSTDVQRWAGAGIVDRYATAVDLENYDCHVRVDVIDRTVLVGVQLTEASLSKRFPRVYNPPTALKPNVAYAMLRWTIGERAQGSLLDPFCGAGTVLLEAAVLHPELALHGSDVDPRCVEGTVSNAEAVGLAGRLDVRCCDVRDLAEGWGRRFDWVVTNPPYGVRLGRGWNFGRFYECLLGQIHRVLEPAGRAALLVFKRAAFERVVRRSGRFNIADVHLLETGGLNPRLYILQPVAAPEAMAGEA